MLNANNCAYLSVWIFIQESFAFVRFNTSVGSPQLGSIFRTTCYSNSSGEISWKQVGSPDTISACYAASTICVPPFIRGMEFSLNRSIGEYYMTIQNVTLDHCNVFTCNDIANNEVAQLNITVKNEDINIDELQKLEPPPNSAGVARLSTDCLSPGSILSAEGCFYDKVCRMIPLSMNSSGCNQVCGTEQWGKYWYDIPYISTDQPYVGYARVEIRLNMRNGTTRVIYSNHYYAGGAYKTHLSEWIRNCVIAVYALILSIMKYFG